MYREWKGTEFHKEVLSMNLETTRLRGRPRNRWHNEVRKDEDYLGELGGEKEYTTGRNGRRC